MLGKMFEKLGWWSFLLAYHLPQPSAPVVEPSQPQVPIRDQEMLLENEHIKIYQKKIEDLEVESKNLAQENKKLTADLKAAQQNHTFYYGALGATIAVSTFMIQSAFGFLEPQHTARVKDILTDALVVAGCGYIWSLIGCMHQPRTWRDVTTYRAKIIPNYTAAFGGLSTAIVLGNAFITTKGYNQALFCGGIMVMMPLSMSAGFHWWQHRKESMCLKG